MDGVDVVAKLCRLRDNLDGLSEDDKTFVTEVVNLHETGTRPKIGQVLRIAEIRVPGEEIHDSRIWTQGTVSVVDASLQDVIWRYMPLEQLFGLLWKNALHFSPLSRMVDPTEGQLPPQAWEATKRQLPKSFPEDRDGMDAATMTDLGVEQRRTAACLSCWYMNESDSLDMWQQYAPRNGVAIQSTVHRLASCFCDCQTPITIIPVKYFTPEEEDRYTFEAFCGSLFNKHDKFRHEKELRALTFQVNIGCGADIPVSLGVLIVRLVLSPELPDWAAPLIIESVRRFRFDGPIEKSALKVTP